MIVDLRSDTVTKPTPEMKQAMFDAPLGDDVLGDDPSVKELEQVTAAIFGKEAGLYCASGTMTNQIAINVHTNPGDELICHEEAHIYRYEGGGIAKNSGVSTRFMRGNHGRIYASELESQINPDDQHYPKTSLVCLEDTANRGGGVVYDFEEIKKINAFCNTNNLKLHLDGARVFNALIENGISPVEYGSQFDSISICLSKGLGAPVGSVLVGSKDFIYQANRVRKVFGGGMRQAGIIASGGTFALKNQVIRLKEDHLRAKKIGELFNNQAYVKSIQRVETNIVIIHLSEGLNEKEIAEKLNKKGVWVMPFGKSKLRAVTHLDINDEHLNYMGNNLALD